MLVVQLIPENLLFMKSKPKPKVTKLKTIAILHSSNKEKKKPGYDETAMAIKRKLDEIKKENNMPSAVNNNLSLFRYKVWTGKNYTIIP